MAADGIGQAVAAIGRRVINEEILYAPSDLAVLINGVGRPEKVGGKAYIGGKRPREPGDVRAAVGFAVFMCEVEAVSENIVPKEAATCIDVLAAHRA